MFPGGRVHLMFALEREPREIGHVTSTGRSGIGFAESLDTFRVTGAAARGTGVAASSGLPSYTRGTVQAAIAAVPGVVQDQFANAIVRGGKVDDVVFSYDAVPVPQALIAEPGGNVIGAQLPTTGSGYAAVTTGGFSSGSDNALAAVVDETPTSGVYPAQGRLDLGEGVAQRAQDVELEERWARPDLTRRYAVDAIVGTNAIRYGDGRTFYPAEAATYGLSLASRAFWSVASNAHLKLNEHDDLELLALAGETTYDQYGTPFSGQTYGAFDGPTLRYPREPSPTVTVTTPSRIRGTYAIAKLQLLRTYAHSYARLRYYRSQYGAATDAPFFDDLSFPNGVVSYFGRQSGNLYGAGLDFQNVSSERQELEYGVEVRQQSSALDQLVPTLDEHITSLPTLFSSLSYLSDRWSLSSHITVSGALRAIDTHVKRSDRSHFQVAAVDPHVSMVYRSGANAVRLTYDHTTVPPKPLQVERFHSTTASAPLAPLGAERADSFELSFEHAAATQLRLTAFEKRERDRIDVIPTNYRSTIASGEQPGTGIGIPQNVGELRSTGLELWVERGPASLSASYVDAVSSSASQFGLNNLNAPAIAAGHLFPVGYVPKFVALLSYRMRIARVTLMPTLSYESGYPYGNGRKAWAYDKNGQPTQVLNDNHINPGYNYYFLRDPSQTYDAAMNPIIATLQTPEGDDPNTLRSTPQLLASLHVESALTPRVTVMLDVANLFGTSFPTQFQGNPYLIGPPGYTGANTTYANWYGQQFNGRPYTLGNGVPTNNGTAPAVPWTYGTTAYVPSSYPEARSISLHLSLRL